MTTLFTVGHSTAALYDLVALMQEHRVEMLVDVRSKPTSRTQHFDYAPLEAAIDSTGITYLSMGHKLGGIPRDPSASARWQSGRLDPVVIAHLRSTEEWFDGLSELAKMIRRGQSLCLMCAEADPDQCHRKAIALDLADLIPDLEITHLAVGKAAKQELGLQEVIP